MEWDILITRQCHAKKKKVKGKKNALTLCVRQGEMKCRRFPEAENKKAQKCTYLCKHFMLRLS